MIQLSSEEDIYLRYKEVYQLTRQSWNKLDLVFKIAQDCIVAPKRVREVLENQDNRWEAFLSKINPNISNLFRNEEKYFASYHNRDCFIELYNKMMLESDKLDSSEKTLFMDYLTTTTNWYGVFESLTRAIVEFIELKKLGFDCKKIINWENLSEIINNLFNEKDSIVSIEYIVNLVQIGCIDNGIHTSTLIDYEKFNHDDILKDIKQKKGNGLLPSEIFVQVILPLKNEMEIINKKNNPFMF